MKVPAENERTYRDWFGDRWADVRAIGKALMLAIRFVIWVFDLDDGAGSKDWREASPSATKVGGILMIVAGLAIIRRRCSLATVAAACGTDGATNLLMTAGMTALFGRAAWKLWIRHNESKTEIQARAAYERKETANTTDIRIRQERCDDGAPPRSLPATGAEVPE